MKSTAAALVSLIVVSAFKNHIIHDPFPELRHVDYCWRILIGLGCIPGCIALYFRLTIPETPRFTMDIERNVRQAAQDIENVLSTGDFYVDPDAAVQRVKAPRASRRDFIAHFSQWKNGKVLLGTAYSWFALDVRFTTTVHGLVLIMPRPDRLLWPWSEFLYCPYRYWLRHDTQERLGLVGDIPGSS